MLLAALLEPAEQGTTPDAVLRPGERVLLGTPGGRAALRALLDGDVDPMASWLERTCSSRCLPRHDVDVPLLDVDSLTRLVRQLVHDTESAPGPARAMVAGEWVAELATDSLPDESTFPEVVRAIGELLLDSDAPILLWHAVQELALVAEDDPRLAERVLERCLPCADAEHGRCRPWPPRRCWRAGGGRRRRAARPHLPALGAGSWDAVAQQFLGRELAVHWVDGAPTSTLGPPATARLRADAVRRAVELAGTPERAALGWFSDCV